MVHHAFDHSMNSSKNNSAQHAGKAVLEVWVHVTIGRSGCVLIGVTWLYLGR